MGEDSEMVTMKVVIYSVTGSHMERTDADRSRLKDKATVAGTVTCTERMTAKH